MPQPQANTMDLNAAAMMTLAGLAYASPSFIADYIPNNEIAGVAWQLVWIADDQADPVNFAFIVRDPARDLCVVAIRGTYPDPFSSAYWTDGSQDSPFGEMQPWPGADGAAVSAGTWAGFNGVLELVGSGQGLSAVLTSLRGAAIVVTGHSLGGTLAPVLALWASTVNPSPLSVYAFAGMTPGNAAFAALFGAGTALDGRVWRYNNTLDTVPYGWDRVLETRNFYQPAPEGGLLVETLLLATAVRLASYGFAAVGEEIALPGQLQSPVIACEFVAYVIENLHQHMPDTYLALLGAPPLPFTIGIGTVLDFAPRTPTGAPQRRMPVYYVRGAVQDRPG